MAGEKDIIAREGFWILLTALILAVGLYFLHPLAGVAGILWFLFCVYFFRNPKRVSPQVPGMLIAPADGKVIFVGEAQEHHFFKKAHETCDHLYVTI